MDMDYHRYGCIALLGVIVHARNLEPEALELEQRRRVYLKPRRTRRGLVKRPWGNGDKEVPLLIPLRLRAVLKRAGKVQQVEEAVHVGRVEFVFYSNRLQKRIADAALDAADQSL